VRLRTRTWFHTVASAGIRRSGPAYECGLQVVTKINLKKMSRPILTNKRPKLMKNIY